MEFEYERDDAVGFVRVRLHGAFEKDGMIFVGDRMRSEGAWSYGLLIDLRGLTSLPTAADLSQLTRYVTAESATEPRGALALVVQEGDLYARACAYLMLGTQEGRQVDVFRHLPDAEEWLLSTR